MVLYLPYSHYFIAVSHIFPLSLHLSFCPQFSGIYLVSLVTIIIGFILFNAVPTHTDYTDPTGSACEEGCFDNPGTSQIDITKQEVVVRLDTDEPEEDQEKAAWEKQVQRKRASGQSHEHISHTAAVGYSTKM